MFAVLFYIVIGWIVFSFLAGGYKYLTTQYPTFNDAQETTVHMLKLPYSIAKMVYESFKK